MQQGEHKRREEGKVSGGRQRNRNHSMYEDRISEKARAG